MISTYVYYCFAIFVLNSCLVFAKPAIDLEEQSSSIINLPKQLLLGAATSAFQTEGAANTNGKSDSYIQWLLKNLYQNVSADVASDSYHRYKEDVKVVEYAKLNVYRFSMSWARLLPSGYANDVNEEGVRYYHALLDELEKIGVEPIVLLHHFDHPIALEKSSDIWQNGEIVGLYKDYARFVFKTFGSRIKNFVTFNEANLFCYQMNGQYTVSPFQLIVNESTRLARTYKCGHNILKAHAEVYHMYHKEFNPNGDGKLSVTVECENFFSKNLDDDVSSDVAFQFSCGWIAHPIYSKTGDYPKVVKQWVKENSYLEGLSESRLPTFSPAWIKRIKGSADYFGLSHYSSHLVEPAAADDPETWINFHIPSDARLLVSEAPCEAAAATGMCVAPEGFRNLLRKINEEYDSPIIYVLENGFSDDGRLNDTNRIKFLYSYIKEVIEAIKYDNIDIRSYVYWSLIDSFEFNQSYKNRFGLAYVDVDSGNYTRTFRKSAAWLRKVLEMRKLYIDN